MKEYIIVLTADEADSVVAVLETALLTMRSPSIKCDLNKVVAKIKREVRGGE